MLIFSEQKINEGNKLYSFIIRIKYNYIVVASEQNKTSVIEKAKNAEIFTFRLAFWIASVKKLQLLNKIPGYDYLRLLETLLQQKQH